MSGSLFPRSITVRRETWGFVKGTYCLASSEEIPIQGSVQPITGRDTDSQEVGRTDIGQVRIVTSATLYPSEQAGTIKDIVIWDSREWEVVRRKNWDNNLLEHVEYEAEYRKRVA